MTAEPLELIKTEGELVLTDNASFFVFKADGTSQSFPSGISGRTLTGTWKNPPGEPAIFEVIALHSWMNGASLPDDYRKINFAIYSGKTKAITPGPMASSVKKVFEGYWLIQELTKVPKPKK